MATPSLSQRLKIAQDAVTRVLADQIAHSESLNTVGAGLAGLAGVIATLAGTSPTLNGPGSGLAGTTAIGLAAVLAVAIVCWPRPVRKNAALPALVVRILEADENVSLEVLIGADIAQAATNTTRLRVKGALVLVAAAFLAVGVAFVVGSIVYYGR